MKELAHHIEKLLTENDCVILPHFGGFVVQRVAARWVEAENLFLPPYRQVGFNDRLTLNDGLLVQSYMEVHDVPFAQAQAMVERAIDALNCALTTEGEVALQGIGNICRTMDGRTIFTPYEAGVLSPEYYGLSSFEMHTLQSAEATDDAKSAITTDRDTVVIRIRRTWIQQVVAAAAAVILFFCLSTPVDNTYIEPENFASVGGIHLFDNIRAESLITSLTYQPVVAEEVNDTIILAPPLVGCSQPAPKTAKNKIEAAAITPATAAEQATATEPTAAATEVMPGKYYFIVVASVTNSTDAERAIAQLAAQGYDGAMAVEGDGRVRIALHRFADRTEAETQLAVVRQNNQFHDAWLLPQKIK